MEFYGPYAKLEEADFPDVVEGQEYAVEKLDLLSKETQPPSRYSQGSIVRELEKHNLGTKTTRATILQTLYDRGYIEDKSIEVTTLGMKVGETLAEYTPELVSEELTRDFEESMAKVEQGKAKKETIMKQARTVITKVSEEFKQNEQKLGETLEDAVIEMQNKKQLLGPCPNCGGELKVLFSPWTKKKFVGCSSYTKCKLCGFTKKACKCKCPICGGLKGKCKCEWKLKVWNPTCGTGFPLPSRGLIESTEKICEQCRTPIIKVIRKGARPFTMCLDPKCKTKEGWLKTPEELEKIKQKKEAAEAKEEAKAVKAEVKVEAKAEPKPAAEKSKKARKKSR
jgi:DNA topoisomerase-1